MTLDNLASIKNATANCKHSKMHMTVFNMGISYGARVNIQELLHKPITTYTHFFRMTIIQTEKVQVLTMPLRSATGLGEASHKGLSRNIAVGTCRGMYLGSNSGPRAQLYS